MESDSGGVHGRLPRSRPGTRSGKRDAAGARRPARAAPAPEHVSDPGGQAPVEAAVRAATRAAGGGVRVASGLTRELLRRLPRP